MGMNAKIHTHRTSVTAHLSDNVGRTFQLPKKTMIQIYRVWKRTKGWQTAESLCATKSITPVSNQLRF